MTAFARPRLGRLRAALQSSVDSGRMPGAVAIVSRKGETHLEAVGTMAFGGTEPMARDTIFRIASMTKPVTAAAAMSLVEEGVLRLDDPVDRLLPELADRKVLRAPDAAVDDTVPAKRAITLRDLLAFTAGYGAMMAPPGTYPMQAAQAEAGFAPGPWLPAFEPDEFMRRLGTLPLLHQPGEGWRYHTGSDVVGVLLARAAGKPFGEVLRERIFEPLGMKDTGFQVPASQLHRLPPSYMTDHATGETVHFDEPGAASRWARPLPFPSGGGGLVSTADDCLAFGHMLLGGGKLGSTRVLSRPSVSLMMSDQVTAAQRQGQDIFFNGGADSWGFGGSVTLRRRNIFDSPGRYGWTGGYGTSAYVDPAEGLAGVLLTQRMMDSPEPPLVLTDFWTAAYQAIED